MIFIVFFFQAEDGIRDLVRSRGLGDVYKRQVELRAASLELVDDVVRNRRRAAGWFHQKTDSHESLSLIHI